MNDTTNANFSKNLTSGISSHSNVSKLLYFYNETAIVYICLGLVGFLTNLLLVVLSFKIVPHQDGGGVSNATAFQHELGRKYTANQILTALYAFGECLIGLGYFLEGLFVRSTFFDSTLSPIVECARQPFVVLEILGRQIPSFATVLLGVERFLAAVIPFWYLHNWNERKAWLLSTANLGISAIVLGIVIYYASVSTSANIAPIVCRLSSIGLWLAYYIYSLTAICGLFSTSTTVLALIISYSSMKKVSNHEHTRKRYHLKISQTITAVICTTFCLVVMPNIVLLLINLGVIPFVSNLATYFHYLHLVNCDLNLFLFVTINRNYRKVVSSWIQICSKYHGTNNGGNRNTIVPLSTFHFTGRGESPPEQ